MLLASVTAAGAGDKAEPLPYLVDVRVLFGASNGPETLRLDLERALTSTLRKHDCFRSVDRAGERDGPANLLLTLTLDEFEDEQQHDGSIAQRYAPGAMPDVERAYVHRLSAKVRMTVATVPGGGTVRTKKFVQSAAHRPLLSEDARLEARRTFIDEIVRTARRSVCKGSAKGWRREVAAAGGEAGETR